MRSTTAYKQGDIVLVRFPFTDLTSTKKRPALVVSPDSFNRFNQDLILVALTSHPPEHEDAVLLEDGDFAEGKLPKKSAIKLTKIFTIHSSLVLRRIGTLKRTKLQGVLKEMRQIFS